MANQLAMDKSFAINNLRAAGYSERRIAQTLGVSRGAVLGYRIDCAVVDAGITFVRLDPIDGPGFDQHENVLSEEK